MEGEAQSVRRVVLFGPESTGKTTLARQLSEYCQSAWAPEYMRQFCEERKRLPEESDMHAILEGQLKNQKEAESRSNRIVVCDTDALQLEVYHNFYFGPAHHLYEPAIAENSEALYLLMDIDLEWEPDVLRDSSLDRKELLEIFRNALVRHDRQFEVIAGKGERRLKDALSVLKQLEFLPA